MLRTLLAPRLWGLHLVVIAAVAAFIFLGRWQLGVFEDSGRPHAADDPAPVAVEQVIEPGSGFDGTPRHRVTASGTYDPTLQLFVVDRKPDADAVGGKASRDEGFWVLTPIRLDDGTLVPVVRSWVAQQADAPAVPSGKVQVTGRISPPESTDSVQRRSGTRPGQVQTVSTAELINLWPGEKVRNGFVVASDSGVAAAPPQQGGSVTWRNLAYALNWWIFAVFAVFMWFHYVREAVRTSRGQQWSQPSSPSEFSPTSSG
ncbi:SURF1 family protein [Nonomuraea sp. NPDC050663]|uniref:SURF1 family protein n=1 Tax=Nonomuraea sp. NPDC050663 TaxID=3364370 RepID=UPI0037944B18